MMNRTGLRFCVCIGVLSLAACGTMVSGPAATEAASADPVVIVTARAEARWKALIEGNVGTAYDYLSPATRALLSRGAYQSHIKSGMWREAKATSVTCEPDLCKVKIKLKYDIQRITGLEIDLDENWIKQEGGWWFVQKK